MTAKIGNKPHKRNTMGRVCGKSVWFYSLLHLM